MTDLFTTYLIVKKCIVVAIISWYNVNKSYVAVLKYRCIEPSCNIEQRFFVLLRMTGWKKCKCIFKQPPKRLFVRCQSRLKFEKVYYFLKNQEGLYYKLW